MHGAWCRDVPWHVLFSSWNLTNFETCLQLLNLLLLCSLTKPRSQFTTIWTILLVQVKCSDAQIEALHGTTNEKVSVAQYLCGMCHALYLYGMSWRHYECVLYNNLRWPAHREVNPTQTSLTPIRQLWRNGRVDWPGRDSNQEPDSRCRRHPAPPCASFFLGTSSALPFEQMCGHAKTRALWIWAI